MLKGFPALRLLVGGCSGTDPSAQALKASRLGNCSPSCFPAPFSFCFLRWEAGPVVRGMLEQGAACGQSLEAPGVFPAAPQPHLAPTHQRLAGGGVLTFWLERG